MANIKYNFSYQNDTKQKNSISQIIAKEAQSEVFFFLKNFSSIQVQLFQMKISKRSFSSQAKVEVSTIKSIKIIIKLAKITKPFIAIKNFIINSENSYNDIENSSRNHDTKET